jgi:DNA-binding NarL/FixJ family response regulator
MHAIFFRCDGIIIAVLTMMRDSSLSKFSEYEIQKLISIQKFLEYSLNLTYLPARVSQRKSISKHYELTDRELDVLEWIIAGAENKIVAKELSISLATVKTHLVHIYTKLNVNSRAKILVKIFSEINNDGKL